MPKKSKLKNKKDSNRMVKYDRLIRDCNIHNKLEYLNISIKLDFYCAGMAEWLLQSFDTRCPSGFVGSIPTPGAVSSNFIGVS